MSVRSERLQKEINETMKDIPPMLVGLNYEWLRNKAMKDSRYIFYKRRGKSIYGVCTECKERVTPEGAAHNSKGYCPNCKTRITYKAVNKAKRFIDSDVVSVMQKMKNNKYVIRYIKVTLFFKDGEDTTDFPFMDLGRLIEPEMRVWEGSREIFEVHENRRLKLEAYEELYDWKTKDWEWKKERKRGMYFNKELLRESMPVVYKNNLKQLTKHTRWKYSAIEQYQENKFHIFDYLDTYERYPAIEMLSKLNMTELLEQIIRNTSYYGGISGILKMDEKMLGMEKGVFNTVKRLNLNIKGIEFVSTINELNKRLTDEQIVWATRTYNPETFIQILRYVSPQKAINYVEKHEHDRKNNYLTTWRDYLNQCEELELDLKDDIILFPKDLKAKHEEYTQLIKQKVIKKYDIGIKEQYAKWQKLLGYNQGPLRIEVASGHKKLLEEGKILKHCVGSYSSRMANGETLILFIRKNGKPYYTVEFKPDTLKTLQIRGLQNKAASNDIKKFMNKWKVKKVMNIRTTEMVAM